jgi:hypothetical protein
MMNSNAPLVRDSLQAIYQTLAACDPRSLWFGKSNAPLVTMLWTLAPLCFKFIVPIVIDPPLPVRAGAVKMPRIIERTSINKLMITNNSSVLERISKLLVIKVLDILYLSINPSLEGPSDPGVNDRMRDGRGGRYMVLVKARILARIKRVGSPGRWRALPRGRVR